MTNLAIRFFSVFLFAIVTACSNDGQQSIVDLPSQMGEVQNTPTDMELLQVEGMSGAPVNGISPHDFTTVVSEPVFVGAEGFGVYTSAGKNGIECWVSNLHDTGPGSLRECVNARSPRTIKFAVSGRIELLSTLEISHPWVSILGQSAPSNGILLSLSPLIDGPAIGIRTHDVLIQHLRIRPGPSDKLSCCRDAVSIGNEESGQVYNVVLDHNSLSWATDEIIEIWFDSRDITISRNIISEGLHRSTNEEGPAGRGLLVGSKARSISVHHNLFAHNYERNPSISGVGVTDMVNNIIYHWVSRGTQINARNGDSFVNIDRNLFISHLDSQLQPSAINWYDVNLTSNDGHKISIYFNQNIGYWRTDSSMPQWSLAGTGWQSPYDPALSWHSGERHQAPKISAVPVEQLEQDLQNNVGATLPVRDSVDSRLLNELSWRSGYMPDCVQDCELDAHGWPYMGP